MTETRHIVAFSGGKDSSALAIYLHDPARWRRILGKSGLPDRPPLTEAEYVFCDTGTELEETYEYLGLLEAYLGRPIVRLSAESPPGETPFDHHLQMFGGLLPSSQMRWCTRKLKLEPYEKYIGEEPVISYVGIRGDEDREGYISTKPNIRAVFPFKEDGIVKDDVYKILAESGVGVPEYYSWRSRSGCYFCFYQRKSEWVGLMENHPDLFEKAKSYEKIGESERFTWSDAESLEELASPERVADIKQKVIERSNRIKAKRPNLTLLEQFFDEVRDAEDDGAGCSICHL